MLIWGYIIICKGCEYMSTFVKVNGTWKNTGTSIPIASSSTYGVVKSASNVTSTTGLTPCPIINGIPYYYDASCEYSIDTVTFERYTNTNTNTFTHTITCGFKPRLILPLPVSNDVYVSLYNFNPEEITVSNERYNISCEITLLNTGYKVHFPGAFYGNLTKFSRRYIAFK